ncbi:MAG: PH domain-containing protein [Actinobacteria bacterium]|nr:PH domain-containing protein [Actinomycetota bacterium]
MSDNAPSTKLPRNGHAPKLRPEETVLKKTSTDLNNGWLGRHGQLHLTDERLLFVPTPLDHVLGAKRHEIPLNDIRAVERWPLSPGEVPRGAKRPRLFIDTATTRYIFLAPDLDGWFDLIQLMFYKRSKEDPGSGRPEFRRTGVENGLLITVASLESD